MAEQGVHWRGLVCESKFHATVSPLLYFPSCLMASYKTVNSILKTPLIFLQQKCRISLMFKFKQYCSAIILVRFSWHLPLFISFSSLKLSTLLVVFLPMEMRHLWHLFPHSLCSPCMFCSVLGLLTVQDFHEWPQLDMSYHLCSCDIQLAWPSLQNSGPIFLLSVGVEFLGCH